MAAAAPINCLPCVQNYLQAAIMNHFCTQDYAKAVALMTSNPCKKYMAQNNTEILNGAFDMRTVTIPKAFRDAQVLKIDITVVSQNYKEYKKEPELVFGLYKNIGCKDLSKKFETQQFTRHFMMKKYEVPLIITDKNYKCGLQKLTGTINLNEIERKDLPLRTVVRFTKDGIRKYKSTNEPKTIVYAYLFEFEKIK